jgi:hypothetical protein
VHILKFCFRFTRISLEVSNTKCACVHSASTKQLQDISAVNIYNSDKFIIFIFETQNRTQARLYQHTHAHFALLTSDEMRVKRKQKFTTMTAPPGLYTV